MGVDGPQHVPRALGGEDQQPPVRARRSEALPGFGEGQRRHGLRLNVSLSLRRKDLVGTVTRVHNKKKNSKDQIGRYMGREG